MKINKIPWTLWKSMKMNADPWKSTICFFVNPCKSTKLGNILTLAKTPAKLHNELNQNEHVLLSTHINEHMLATLARVGLVLACIVSCGARFLGGLNPLCRAPLQKENRHRSKSIGYDKVRREQETSLESSKVFNMGGMSSLTAPGVHAINPWFFQKIMKYIELWK